MCLIAHSSAYKHRIVQPCACTRMQVWACVGVRAHACTCLHACEKYSSHPVANSRLNHPLTLWLIADELEDIHSPLSNPAPTFQSHRSLHHGFSPTLPQRSQSMSTQPRKLNQAIKDGSLAKVHATPLTPLLCMPQVSLLALVAALRG